MAVSRSRPTRTSESLVDFAESCACEKPRQPARLCEPALERLHRLCRYRRARFSQPREYFAPRKTELGSVYLRDASGDAGNSWWRRRDRAYKRVEVSLSLAVPSLVQLLSLNSA
jgi:hypothetical protein